MANFNNIKNEIDQNVNTNGVQAITGAILNETLKDMIDDVDSQKQDTLVSGQNIKTINNQSLLGSGNITIQGGSGSDYYAGQGIDIDENNVISVDGAAVAGRGLTSNGSQVDLDLSQVIGDGLDWSGDDPVLSVDASDLAGFGLTTDGNGNLAVDTNTIASQSDLANKQDTLTFNLPININPGDNSIELLYGDGLTMGVGDTLVASIGNGLQFDINSAIEVDTNIIATQQDLANYQPVLTAGDGVEIDGNNEISVKAGSGLGFDANGYLVNTGGGGGGQTLVAGDGIEIDSNDAINAKLGNGLQLDANNDIEIDPSVVASQSDLSSYLRNDASGTVQNFLDGTGDTELTVMDGMSEDYVRLGAYETAGVQPHVEIFENGSGDTKFFYDHIERGSQVSIDLPSSSGTIALTSDIPTVPTASSLAGNGLQDDGNGALEIDTTVVATQSDLSDYLPLTGGTLNNTGQINTNLSVQSPNSDYHVNTYVPNSGSVEIEIGMSSGHAVQNHSDGDTKNLRVYKDKVDLYTYDSGTSNWRADSLYFPKKKTGTLALDSDLVGKQDALVSGTNIKTINGNSLLGSGDIQISGGGLTAGNGIDITSGTVSVDIGSGLGFDQNGALEVIGGGGSGLWTNGTGTNSLMAPESVSSGATASGTGALNAGYYDSVHPANPSGASGNYSAVFGTGTRATSDNAFVTGEGNAASGQRSFVGGGVNNVASGRNSAVLGGDDGHAVGENTVAISGGYAGPGNGAVAIRGTASALGSVSINGTSEANTSVAIQGGHTYSTASGSVAIIGETDGQYSVAIGRGTHAWNENEVATGSYNKTYQSQTASIATSFTVGNGASGSPSNALEFKQNSDAYLYGVGNYDGTNAGASGVHTLQYVINNAGGGGTSFTPGDALELDQNDNLNVLYGSGLTLNGNNELEVDPTSITGFLPDVGGGLQQTDPNETATSLSINSPLGNGAIELATDDDFDGDGNSKSQITLSDSDGSVYIGTTGINNGSYTASWPSPSADTTFATLEDVSGFLPLEGGQLQDTAVGATETLLDIVSPDSTGALSFSTDTLSSAIALSSDRDDANVADGTTYGVEFDNSGDVDVLVKTVNPLDPTDISTTTYTQTFQQKSGTIALLSDISGSGTQYTAGSGISISAQNVISNSAPSKWVVGSGTNSLAAPGLLYTRAGGNNALAICNGRADGNYSLGCGGRANSQYSIALGLDSDAGISSAIGENSIAIGRGTITQRNEETALGYYNYSNNSNTASLGTSFSIGAGGSSINRSNVLEFKDNKDLYIYGIGGFTGTNGGSAGINSLQVVLNGKQDALTAGTGISISGNVISATGGGGGSSLWTSGTGTDSLVAPATITAGLSVDPAQGTGAISCGYDTNADGDYAFAQGGQSSASGDYSFAANNGTSSGDYSASFGSSGAYGNDSFAAGTGSIAGAAYSVALAGGITTYDDSDPYNIINAEGSVAIGNGAAANAYQAIAIGSSASTSDTAIDGIAIGVAAYANAQEATAIGSGSTAEGLGSVALSSGTATGERSTAMSSGNAVGSYSVAGGMDSIAGSYSSVALGFNTMTYDQGDPTDPSEANAGEAAFGRYNYTEQDFIFTVGCGQEIYHDPDDPDFEPNPEDPDNPDGWTEIVRQNAITITTDGSIYIKGAGGYLGQGIAGADSLQTLLYNLNPQ